MRKEKKEVTIICDICRKEMQDYNIAYGTIPFRVISISYETFYSRRIDLEDVCKSCSEKIHKFLFTLQNSEDNI